jgi:hypothetical protein
MRLILSTSSRVLVARPGDVDHVALALQSALQRAHELHVVFDEHQTQSQVDSRVISQIHASQTRKSLLPIAQ